MYQILCENLALGYEGREIIGNLNFEVNKGDYLCVIGENGSGKSTLMKTLLSLQQPMRGKISRGDSLKQNDIGYLPQQTPVQKDFPASVWEIVISGTGGNGRFKTFYTKADKIRAEETIEKLSLGPLKKRCYRELSGGQQQRVLLARALCATDKVLLLDEPVTGLDPKMAEEMYSLIETLNKDGTTIIMITHDINAARLYATHILSLGEKIYFGPKSDYFERLPESEAHSS